MCTLSYVDDAMRRKIAAHGASFRKAIKSPFGSSDEIGMLNLITAESRDAILSSADAAAFDADQALTSGPRVRQQGRGAVEARPRGIIAHTACRASGAPNRCASDRGALNLRWRRNG